MVIGMVVGDIPVCVWLPSVQGYAFHKALAADWARLRKIALAIFLDVRTAEEQYRLSVPTKNQWFKDAFDAEGACSPRRGVGSARVLRRSTASTCC